MKWFSGGFPKIYAGGLDIELHTFDIFRIHFRSCVICTHLDSKLPILVMACQVGGEDAQVFDHFRRQVSEPVGKPGRNDGETKNGKQGRKKKTHPVI